MARPKSREAILGEIQQLTTSIDALKKKLTEHDKAEAARIGGLAMKAGLGSIAIPEEVLTKASRNWWRDFVRNTRRWRSPRQRDVEALDRLRRELMLKRNEERKQDAHQKIKLGGLIVKAGLADIPTNVLLGLLVEGRERIRDPAVEERLARLGDKEFTK